MNPQQIHVHMFGVATSRTASESARHCAPCGGGGGESREVKVPCVAMQNLQFGLPPGVSPSEMIPSFATHPWIGGLVQKNKPKSVSPGVPRGRRRRRRQWHCEGAQRDTNNSTQNPRIPKVSCIFLDLLFPAPPLPTFPIFAYIVRCVFCLCRFFHSDVDRFIWPVLLQS